MLQSAATPANAHDEVRTSSWGQVLLLALILFAAGAMVTVFGPLQEASRLDLQLSDFQMSLVQGIAVGAPVAAVSLAIAWIIDHGNRVRLLTALFVICVIGTFWTAFATGFWPLFLARMLTGVGAGCALGVIVSLSADLCVPDHRGRAIVVLGLGTFTGAAAAFLVTGLMLTLLEKHPLHIPGAAAPWRGTHLIVGAACSLLLAPLFLLREPERHEQERIDGTLGPALMALWNKRGFIIPLFIGQLGVGMADNAAKGWAAPLLIRHYHQQPAQFAGWMSALILFGGVGGSVIGGFGADLGKKSGRRGWVLLAAVIATGCGMPAALFAIMPTVSSFAVVFSVLMFAGTITSIVATSSVTMLIPNEERGACMAAFSVANAVIGQFAPTVVAVWSTAMGGEQYLATALTWVVAVTGVTSFAGYVFAMRNAPLSATEPSLIPA